MKILGFTSLLLGVQVLADRNNIRPILNPKQQCKRFIEVRATLPEKQRVKRYSYTSTNAAQAPWFGSTAAGASTAATQASTQASTTGGGSATTTIKVTTTTTEKQTTAQTSTAQPSTTKQAVSSFTANTGAPLSTVKSDKSTTATEPNETTGAPVSDATTVKSTTVEPATKEATTTVNEDTTAETTEAAPEKADQYYLVILDETGSMQYLGPGRTGRDVIIEKFNKLQDILKKKVNKGTMDDGKYTFVTFNEKAVWSEYSSILSVPDLDYDRYNPGYATNLYDTLGCTFARFQRVNEDAENVKVFIISDGEHKPSSRDRYRRPNYKPENVNSQVSTLRDDFNWEFHYYAAIEQSKKELFKQQATSLGFRRAEVNVFNFEQGSINTMLRKMRQSFGNTCRSEKCLKKKNKNKGRPGRRRPSRYG